MSFYLNNIMSDQMFDDLLKEKRILLVRFGYAAEKDCERLDRMLASINQMVSRYFAIAAYETRDVTELLRKKYNITEETRHILVFFTKGAPIYVSFCKRPSFQICEYIPGVEEMLSLLIMVHQGITHNKKIINVYGTYFENKKSVRKLEKQET
ncbi:U5 snRNP protein, DIM1 family [Nematocida parisii]|uniref:Uncharacterized protein n=1 Tax=Nematocida parisii (strain ERTm3) TaxID=935791 RepID=I3EHK0_NEMP3|nr:uncharacterized protein NEPG_00474 [Nematocida parisii ERTm1]EIJ88697.1 hypothetical protein NEQG_01387 [Nematocida parisii ERTm3]KAI5143798.1 U5 snRNP protein, DIM1 family [Nematocida parisii]EIJ94949.1 hypothetical protein NEPG_00474 [Nematocida parisii ERTm1]KAI5155329.1 U5 snRNP protein, DIM1 family [Nematocida parisii]KAI5158028.1 U5 snRNP protein, DIM1 family [Nematocida parisii]|eukprot:XP_013058305.1 hypothetical protein NEPG_00474 [Nematocida parisii ERTm1]